MASTKLDDTLLTAVFELFCSSNSRPLIIDQISVLSLEDELRILNQDRISDMKKRKALTVSLYERIPDLKNTAYKRIRFKSVLSAYYKTCIELDSLTVEQWTPRHVPLSLFIFITKRLQQTITNNPDDDKAIQKEMKGVPSSCKFIGYIRQFCNEEHYDGSELWKFKQGGGKALKFVQRICKKYKLKFGQFAKAKNLMSAWFTDIDKLVELQAERAAARAAAAAAAKTRPPVEDIKEPVVEPEPIPAGSKWFWMDMEELCWTPFADETQQLLNQSYANRVKSVEIAKGEYRVEFEIGNAAGSMFEKDDDDAIMVVRAESEDGEIHGCTCSDVPQF